MMLASVVPTSPDDSPRWIFCECNATQFIREPGGGLVSSRGHSISLVECFFRAVDTAGPDGPNPVSPQDRDLSAGSSSPLINWAIRAETVKLVADWLAGRLLERCGTPPDGKAHALFSGQDTSPVSIQDFH